MEKHVMVVLTNAVEGKDDEFNTWYNDTHIPQVLEAAGIVAARRYRLSEAQIMDSRPYRYLALYEIEGDPAVALEALQKRSATMDMSDSLAADALANVFSPIAEKVYSR